MATVSPVKRGQIFRVFISNNRKWSVYNQSIELSVELRRSLSFNIIEAIVCTYFY